MLSVGRSCEKVCFELGVRVADGESGESSQDNDLLDSLCVREKYFAAMPCRTSNVN